MGFVHLHCHSEYSILDASAKVKDLVRRAAELGMPAIALTDHGVMGGVMELDDACKEVSQETGTPIKPIFGCEIYLTDHVDADGSIIRDKKPPMDYLVLLAKNNEGYRNLARLVSKSHLDNLYFKPLTTPAMLQEYGRGLVCLSGGAEGLYWNLYLGKDEEAFAWAERLAACFAPGDFYIEVQNHGHCPDDFIAGSDLGRRLAELARRGGWKLVAANDVHYVRPEDAEVRDLLLCVLSGRTVDDPDRLRYIPNGEYYLKSEAEVRAGVGSEFAEACDNTLEIAEKCNVTLPRGCGFPRFPLPPDETAASYLRKLCEKGLFRLVGPRSPETESYWDRYEDEAETIIFFECENCFLVMQELVNWAREHGICVGPGRSSAGDSLVNWLLGITEIDPIAHSLVFERFLPLDGATDPDIDIDFESGRRDEVVRHLKDLYGEDHVAGIITYGRIWARNAVRDATRLLDYPYPLGDRLCKMLPVNPAIKLMDAIEKSPDLKAAYEKETEVHEIIEVARKLEGHIRSEGVHACGVVLGADPLSDHVPLKRDTNGKAIITQFDAANAEAAGLMKLDLLPMKTLGTISAACRLINERHGTYLVPDDIPVDDAQAFAMLSSGKTDGLFMVGNPGYRSFFEKLPSVTFEDVVASVALAERPGPLTSGMTDEYLDIRLGVKPAHQYDPRLNPILAETGGMVIYQEQFMRIAMEMCGFPGTMANTLRKAMGKNRKDILAKMKEQWDAGAAANGFTEGTAEAIWNEALRHGPFLFSKAHAVGYAMIIMRTAFLKAYFSEDFLAASSQA